MTRQGVLWAGAFCGGLFLVIGPSWLGVILLAWALVKTWRVAHWPMVAALVLGLMTGFHAERLLLHPPVPAGAVTVMPTDWTVQDTFVRFTGQVANGVPVSGSATISAAEAKRLKQLATPAVVQWRGNPTRLAGPRNQYEFDYAKFAWYQYQRAYELPRQPLQYSERPVRGVHEWLVGLRLAIGRRIAQLPAIVAKYARGLLLGQLGEDFDEMRPTFVTLGIFHLFSVSGLHIYALLGALYAFTDRLRLPKEGVDWGLIVTLPALLIIIPPGAGITRAVWLRWAGLINQRLHWHWSPLDVFSAVLVGNLLWQPFVLHTFGGQLTYLMTGGLLLLPHDTRWQTGWWLGLLSMPVILAHTFRLHLLSTVFNWLLLPVFELALLPLLGLAVVWPTGPVVGPLATILGLVEAGLTRLAGLPGQVVFGALPAWAAVIGVGLVFSVAVWHQWWQLMVWAVSTWLIVNIHPAARVTMFDVGQGDAILIEAPFKRGTMLIDTGGRGFGQVRNPPAIRAILPYLYARGIDHLDVLLLTHADADHLGDAAALTKQLPVTTVVTTAEAASYPAIKAAVAGRVRQQVFATGGDSVRAGQLVFSVLAPRGVSTEKNADSLVLYGKIGNSSWLFTGDADQTVEKTAIIPSGVRFNFLKVGHHGSKTATSPALLVDQPLKAALISAGVNNRYGHPHPETLTTLHNAGVPVWNTATGGMLWVVDDTVHEFLKR